MKDRNLSWRHAKNVIFMAFMWLKVHFSSPGYELLFPEMSMHELNDGTFKQKLRSLLSSAE